jgi:hypothetical protein
LVSPATAFIATLHEATGSAITLYCVPVCPENFHDAPETWPHRCPNEAGTPAPTADDAVPVISTPTASIRRKKRGTFLSHLIVLSKLVPLWVSGTAKPSEAFKD